MNMPNYLIRRSFLLYCILVLSARMCLAQTAISNDTQRPVITYQGSIANARGEVIPDGSCAIRVSVWSDENTGTMLWSDEFKTTVKNGVFNIALGSQRPLP